ncbi:MAG TPA: hypothetical protein VFA24_02295 [Gaiellaceae bacterium]|nr:hypothetical protein [Gaiellaceae bacterium]
MTRRLACALALAALAVAPAAAGDGPTYLMFGWTGVTAPGTSFRYVTLPAGSTTVLAQIRRSTGRVWAYRSLSGTWGIPQVASDGTAAGLSRDGRMLVIGSHTPPYGAPATTSRFLLLNAKTLRVWRKVVLRGDFTFDALSPGGGTLFLIQHLYDRDATSYRVRAYDIGRRLLLPRVIADRRQSSWTMDGSPVTRATSADGRWAYTLYQQPDGFPFVHALDTVARVAHCIGIPWRGSQDTLYSTRMRLRGRTLTLTTYEGDPLFEVDAKTFWVKRSDERLPLGLAALVSSLR